MNEAHPHPPQKWADRTFRFFSKPEDYPLLIDRLRSAPVRMAGLLYGVPDPVLTAQPDGKWSMLQHAGHLFDLEELAVTRLSEYRSGAQELSPADMANEKTERAGHNASRPVEIVEHFQEARWTLTAELAGLPAGLIERRSRHPRLGMVLRLIDWVEFMAEHDDHHLGVIGSLRGSLLREGGLTRN